jgi:hypothetical protein
VTAKMAKIKIKCVVASDDGGESFYIYDVENVESDAKGFDSIKDSPEIEDKLQKKLGGTTEQLSLELRKRYLERGGREILIRQEQAKK